LLYPVYNEDFAKVLAHAHEGYVALGEDQSAFEVFFLSNSTSPERVAAEARIMRDFAARHGGLPFFYRRRTSNTERKAGNIADFSRKFGARYDYMMGLDADSSMPREALRPLVARMDKNPATAVIQTVPGIHGARSLFARMQQFALSAYGPLFGYGLAWWSGGAGNYWGHNAIVRVHAFAAHAGLPLLTGR